MYEFFSTTSYIAYEVFYATTPSGSLGLSLSLPLTILAIDRTAFVVLLNSTLPAATPAPATPAPAAAPASGIMLPLPTLDPRYPPIAVLRLRLA